MDNTAVIFSSGLNTRRLRLVFIFRVLSNIVNQFLLIVHLHLDLALFSADHNTLIPHAAYHIKRLPGLASQGQLQSVFFHPLLQGLFKGGVYLEEPICRAKPADTLMRAFVVVIFDPERDPACSVLVAGELGPLQKLGQNALPESLYLTQRHGMVGTRPDMLDPVFFKFLFKPGGASPIGILAAVVGEHLFGHAVFAHGPAIGLDHILGRLAAVKSQTGNVAAIIIQIANEIGVLTVQAEGQDIALPQLVGSGPLEETRLGGILLRLSFHRLGESLVPQCPLHRGGARRHKEKPSQDVGYPPHPVTRIFLFQRYDALGYCGRVF